MNSATMHGTDRSRETLKILRDNITSGRWPLNSKIPTESELMVELGVGRSTLREAVSSLTAMGMLEPARSRGTFVRSASPVSAVLSDFVDQHSTDDIMKVRRLLEVEATRLAALFRTDEQLQRLAAAHAADRDGEEAMSVERGGTPGQFHAIILEAAGNSLLIELYAGLMRGVRGSLRRGELVPAISESERHADHDAILAAITAQDPEAARQAAAAHVDHDLMPAE